MREIDLRYNADLTSVDALIECLPRSNVVRVRLTQTGVPVEKKKVVIRVLSETAARLVKANDPGLQRVAWSGQNVGRAISGGEMSPSSRGLRSPISAQPTPYRSFSPSVL